ncbi:MAG: transporter substrate-binding domain-containing protein [Ruminococcaceae bacterium]|nr:transporter substrate-binding domain-containing protein [Oscillospiraceae bacterium]
MKKFVKIISLLMVIAMLAVTLCSCGDSSDDTATEAVKVVDIELTQEEYAFGVDKTQPELLETVNAFIAQIKADGTFDEICNKYFGDGTPTAVKSAALDTNKEQLVVATNAAFEPFEYTVGEDYYGIDMEIAALLAEHLGQELVISNMDFDSVCLSVGQQKCDIAMAGLTIKPDREEYVNFSDSYYEASQKLIVKGDDTAFDACTDAASVEALLNALAPETKIGVQNGTTGQFYVEGDEEWGFAGYDVQCVGYKNGSLAVQDLINGGVNYVIIDSAPAACITEAINAVQ